MSNIPENKKLENEQKKIEKRNERSELIKYRKKIKSEIIASKIKRDDLLLNISKKIANVKAQEDKLKLKLQKQAAEEKELLNESKIKDKKEILLQKNLINDRKKVIQEERNVIKEQLNLLIAENKNAKLAQAKINREKISSANSIWREQRLQHKKEINEIKLKTIELKTKLRDQSALKKEEQEEITIKAKQVIQEEKIKLSDEKEKLRNIKIAAAAVAKAKRVSKFEKTRLEKEELRREKSMARDAYKAEVLSFKTNKTKNEIELNDEKSKAFKEVEEYENKLEQENEEKNILKQESNKEVVVSHKETTNEFSDEYHSIFIQENEVKKPINYENASGLIIDSFGKKGISKFTNAQMIETENSTNKLKNDPLAMEMIEKFNKFSGTSINIRSLIGYLEILLSKRFKESDIEKFHAHAITAILTEHSIKFANGFISSVRIGKKLVLEFSKELENETSLVEFINPKIGREINLLITNKLNSGEKILLANGLIATRESKEIKFLLNSNFMKA